MALRASRWMWIVGLGLLLGGVPLVADEPPKSDKAAAKQPANPPQGEAKPADSKLAEPKASDAKPADKTADSKSAEAKSDDKAGSDKAKPSAEEDYELYKIFADTLDQVERNYVKDVSRRELMEAAIRGVLGKLDPYSNYIGPEDLGRFRTSVESQFGGIGIQITVEEGQLKVLSPIVGSPAYRAGLQAGDRIVEIEGKPTENLQIDEAVTRLKGEAGTKVNLTVIHPASTEKHNVTIEREIVELETVLGDSRKDDDSWDFMLDKDKGIAYIRITTFSRDTAKNLEDALKELEKEHFKGLILDLRFNPGGLLTSAIEIADLFIAEGKIVSTVGRNSPERTWTARKPGTYEGFPMAVLVNHYSASASEIVSAALQDHKRAVIIGDRTWGKGSVQNVIELENGKSALKLTTASYQRPNGHNIHRFPNAKDTDEWGVMPDSGMDVKLSDEELRDLVRKRRDRDILLMNHSSEAKAQREADAKKAAEAKENEAKEKNAKDAKEGDKETAKTKDATPEKPADAAKENAAKESGKNDGKGDKPSIGASPSGKPADKHIYIDRQLQKAIEYLNTEMARAN